MIANQPEKAQQYCVTLVNCFTRPCIVTSQHPCWRGNPANYRARADQPPNKTTQMNCALLLAVGPTCRHGHKIHMLMLSPRTLVLATAAVPYARPWRGRCPVPLMLPASRRRGRHPCKPKGGTMTSRCANTALIHSTIHALGSLLPKQARIECCDSSMSFSN